jgi:hypothetical protein
MRAVLGLMCVAFTAVGCSAPIEGDETVANEGLSTIDGKGRPEPPMLGVHWAKDARPSGGGGGQSPLMSFHSGSVLTSTVTQAIFWGSGWGSYSGDKFSGIDTWYEGFGGSHYSLASSEYTGTDGRVTGASSHLGHVIDTSAAPGKAPATSAILAEVCKVVTNPVTNGYYAVYTTTPRGHTSYCAWHSWGQCAGVQLQFAFFFDLDGDAGCDPQDTSGLHSQGLAAIANVTGHELSEAITDPQGSGWFDSSGNENGDKCAWSFGAPLVTFSNGSQWKIQGEWSNAAFNAGTGYANTSGQKGCLSGF